MKLYLIDIDGTLTKSQGVGRESLEKTIYELTGEEIHLSVEDVAGKTDLFIIKQILQRVSKPLSLEAVLEKYLALLQANMNQPVYLKGAHELIQQILESGDVLGLLTGNVAEGAKTKLGEDLFSQFQIYATGDISEDRNDLIRYALDTFYEMFGTMPEKTIVIGDTPRDIECARSVGAMAVAVATGPYPRHHLRDADIVLNDLTEFFRFTLV
ncbi:MAG: HAD family hydrolase [Candidatus Hydrogenedentota bacterium]|nr:MAG: HAD family hydrolase [Candidatus Hydrogenedentota bacterium]